MRFEEIHPTELTVDLVRQWELWRVGNDAMASPFFASELVRLLGSVRDDLRIVVAEDGGRPVAFFPLHRGRWRTGYAMGWPLMDYQGMVAAPQLDLDPRHMLRALKLSRLRFLSIPKAQRWFAPYVTQTDHAPIIRIDRFHCSSKELRKLRKLERDVGPITFTVSAAGGDDLEQLIRWKRDQIARTHFYPLFSHDWLIPLLRRLPRHHAENFEGIFTTLHAGPRLVAAHLGVRSNKAWHMWFPAFDPAFSTYSPGLMMVLLMARAAPELGVEWIDFGCGQEQFKHRLANDAIAVTRGTVTADWSAAGIARAHDLATAMLRRSALRPRLRQLRSAVGPV